MFGTGEWASSASESTRPSCTSSSCRSGTYCRQIGSPGDLMRSTIAGEIRNSKFSAARRSRSRSGKCSAPNLATSASSEAMLCLRSSCCQGAMRQILEINHQVVARGVVAGEPGRLGVAAPLVEGARGCVVGARRRLDDDQSSVVRGQFLLDRPQERRAHAGALPSGIDHDPVEIEGPGGTGCRAPAGVAHELSARVRTEEAIVVVAREGIVEQLNGDGDFVRPEQAGGRREPLKRCALAVPDGTERAAHAPPWRPVPRGARPPRSGAPAPRSPSRRPSPSGRGRRRRDRKSTRLNSSHITISYAVFCLKKKK